jgi:hypothetical protein
MSNLLPNIKITPVLGYFGAGVTEEKGIIIDMAGYEGCVFIYHFAAIVAGGVLNCKLYGNTVSATGGTNLATADIAHTVTSAEALVALSDIAIDVYQPDPTLFRYLEASIDPDSQNAVILGITAVQYNGKCKPDLNAGLIDYKFKAFPAAS